MPTTGREKLKLLLWKNYVLHKRHKFSTVMEVTIPVMFAIILVMIRRAVTSQDFKEPFRFIPFDINVEANTSVAGACYLLYAPDTPLVQEFMEDTIMRKYFPRRRSNFSIRGYANESELEKAYLEERFLACKSNDGPRQNHNAVLAAIVFRSINGTKRNLTSWSEVRHVHYALRFAATHHTGSNAREHGQSFQWKTNLLYPVFQLPGPRYAPENMSLADTVFYRNQTHWHGGSPHYWADGFLYTQSAVETTLRKLMANLNREPKDRIQLERFPYPPYSNDIFLTALQSWLPLIIVFAFIYFVMNIARSITMEKEKRLKEYMKMMGVAAWLHWAAWFITSFILVTFSVILVTVFFKLRIYDNPKLAILSHTDGGILFLFLLNFTISSIALAFLVSTFFSRANAAATGAGIVFFLTYTLYAVMQNQYESLTKFVKFASSLFSNTAFCFGCKIMGVWEGAGVGVQWDNLARVASSDDNWTFFDVNLMLFVDTILYFILTLYVESVFPGEYSAPLPWNFMCTPWYWQGLPSEGVTGSLITLRSGRGSGSTQTGTSHWSVNANPNFERDPAGVTHGIEIQGLTKVYGTNVAVNDLHLTMYEGQITVLLGHNGAGKTTTISMLIGLIPPTSGTATVNGHDIRRNIKAVRESLGICPQHDILFDELTVFEHLRFFAKMKGMSDPQDLSHEVGRMLKAINLEGKRHTLASSLSGGMKRRLSLGIALIAGSKIVLLDEPSSGLDPSARREVWDLIQSEKHNRTMVLSTHHMDEADILGQKIAIMVEGVLQCSGSPLFLKKRYGAGYHLVMVTAPECDVDGVNKFIKGHVPESEMDEPLGFELSFLLPEHSSSQLGKMFEELEKKKVQLGIESYGVSLTTTEEVFIKVGREAEELKGGDTGQISAQPSSALFSPFSSASAVQVAQDHKRNVGGILWCQQMWAMIVKKCLYARRAWFLLLIRTLLPTIFLIAMLLMLQAIPDGFRQPELVIGLDVYTQFGRLMTPIACERGGFVCAELQKMLRPYSDIVQVPHVGDAVLKAAAGNLYTTTYRYLFGMLENVTNSTYRGYFNNQPYHVPPVALNLIGQALLRAYTDRNDTITLSNHPLPQTGTEQSQTFGDLFTEGFSLGFALTFGMSFLAGGFVILHIREREINAKHLQIVSGVKISIYWLSMFLCDFLHYLVSTVFIIISFASIQTKDFNTNEMYKYIYLLLLAYGWSIIPMMYLTSFMFTQPSTGFTRMSMFNLFTVLATVPTISILQIPDLHLEYIADELERLFLLFPNFNLAYGFVQLSFNRKLRRVCETVTKVDTVLCLGHEEHICCTKSEVDFLANTRPGIGMILNHLAITGAVFFVLVFVIENRLMGRCFDRLKQMVPAFECLNVFEMERQMVALISTKGTRGGHIAPMDDDVIRESLRIRETPINELVDKNNLIVKDLTKVYLNLKAVDDLCFAVKKGECFGLLGMNGAGKSSTFKMLTGSTEINTGDAIVHGFSVKNEIEKAYQQIGYCPQVDAFIPELTGKETIRFFSRLRGFKENQIPGIIESVAAKLNFSQHLDKPCGTYSGGNKRKLSTAVALVGNPPLVLLDEPTTGMDVMARRNLRATIHDVRRWGTSVVLTSHSMDECEALCSRLAIMVNGVFRCLGSPQHLKSKFGGGYTLIAQVSGKKTAITHPTPTPSKSKLVNSKGVVSISSGKSLTPPPLTLSPKESIIKSGTAVNSAGGSLLSFKEPIPKESKRKLSQTSSLASNASLSPRPIHSSPSQPSGSPTPQFLQIPPPSSSHPSASSSTIKSVPIPSTHVRRKSLVSHKSTLKVLKGSKSNKVHPKESGVLSPIEKNLHGLMEYIETTFPGCILKDMHPGVGYVHYHIQKSDKITWAFMFKMMEAAKPKFHVEAWSVSQTSLEQVFLGFVKGQSTGPEEE